MVLFSDLHWPLSPCFFVQFFVTVLLAVIREKGIRIHKPLFPRGKEKVKLCGGIWFWMRKVAQKSLQSDINYSANLGRCGGCQSQAGVQ